MEKNRESNNLSEKKKINLKIAKNYADIISKIITARKNANLTQRDLAEKCEIKQAALARMESMRVIPRIDTLLRVTAYLNIEIGIVQHNIYVLDVSNYSSGEEPLINYSEEGEYTYAYN